MTHVFHIPHNHGGFPSRLSHGERGIGLTSTVISEENQYSQIPDITLASAGKKNVLLNRLGVWNAIRTNADIIHFNSGSSLFNPPWRDKFLLDLPFYRREAHKIMTFQGSDIRIEYLPVMEESRQCEFEIGYRLNADTAGGIIPADEITRKKALGKKANKYVDKIFALNPDLLKGLPLGAEFLPYPHVFEKTAIPKSVTDRAKPLKIAHLATNRVLKGTGLIEKQLKDLAQSHNVETRIVVKQPQKIALEAIEWADILIDQVCLGWYGAQAVEALAKGIPVLCYLDPSDREKYLPAGNIGIINCSHHKIAQTLATFCEDRELLAHYGRMGVSFAEDFHDAKKIALYVYRDWIDS